jgi:PKHD-type hydroxylase
MMGYRLGFPLPPAPALVDPMVKISRPWTKGQLDYIQEIGEDYLARHPTPGRVGFHELSKEVPRIRSCTTTWFPFPSDDYRTGEVYESAGLIVQEANARFFQFDIWGFYDRLHYVRYDAGPSDHFAWHQDKGDDWRRPQRKLAIVVLLSDPDEYEGGAFQYFDGDDQTLKAPTRGTTIVFPSFVQHRVTPVTRGNRRSLVGWLCGPRFR